MAHRHIVYCRGSTESVVPEQLLKHLEVLDFWTLAEDYDISEEAVDLALPLQIKNVDHGRFRLYHLSYGQSDIRPIEIERWETPDQHRSATVETIDNLTIEDKTRLKRISEFLQKSVDSVTVSFGIDPPAAMFAWEVVRYFASEFDGVIESDDGEWLTIGRDYQPKLV